MVRTFGFADGVDITGQTLDDTANAIKKTLQVAAGKMGS